MKLVIWEGIYQGKPLKVLAEQVDKHIELEFEPITEGFLTDLIGGAVSYAKAHPIMTTVALAPWAKMAFDALKKYNLTKDTALKFYTKEPNERAKYFNMVKELERTGQYKLVKQGYRDTGYYWELHRRDI